MWYDLGSDYAAAWDEWESSDGAEWDSTIADGLTAAG
jgi:hypothetical protein